MGGSAISADLMLGAYRERMRVPMTVVRDYYLPGWIGENTLVILSSYSGGTEETLTAASQAIERNALCVAITSGGKLAQFYGPEGVPIVPVRPGLQPRAALLRLLVPMLVVLDRMGVIPERRVGPGGGARHARRPRSPSWARTCPRRSNPAKQLARALSASVPLIWGAELTGPIAVRWKGQFNENAKMPAYASALPELDHNEICGFAGMPAELAHLAKLVMLREPRQHRQTERRFDLTSELVEPNVSQVLSITAEGQSPLARMLDLVMLGDYASLYAALLRAVDPGPVEVIERLKERLAQTGYGGPRLSSVRGMRVRGPVRPEEVVRLLDDGVEMLDQTRLPSEEVVLRC